MSAMILQPRAPIRIRPGTIEDIAFMDALQKLHSRQVGWMPTKQFEGKIKAGHVLIAQDNAGEAVGYLIGNDQYFKRDDVGIIYQLNVAPGHQRGLIGASLLKAQFERSAYGCRLYCCWCAQDIAANHFWEAMGFVPLAYRAGSEKKSRVHIFWQKRILAGDTTTPWWFPAQTSGGSIREDRIVLPIPPDRHWSDAKPLILPPDGNRPALEGPTQRKARKASKSAAKTPPSPRPKPEPLSGGLIFAPATPPVPAKTEKEPRAKRAKAKNDPRVVAAARELRDRYLEEVNRDGAVLLPPAKYDVSRALPDKTQRVEVVPVEPKQLPAAA